MARGQRTASIDGTRLGGRRRPLGALAVGVALAAAACGGSGSDPAAPGERDRSTTTVPADAPASSTDGASTERGEIDPGEPDAAGTFAVGSAERSYVDTSRVTVAHGGRPELPSRTLETLVLYPAAGDGAGDDVSGEAVADGADPLPGPWPLIVFGHGSTRAGVDYVDTLSAWASAGYVVAAPNFPLSTTDTPGGTDYNGIEEQTGDVSFVIDEVLAEYGPAASGPTSGLVDPDRIGLGGQSFGAITTLATVANACCADDRVDVATEFAGIWFPLSSDGAVDPAGAEVPILFVHGDDDPTLGYHQGREAWDRIGGPDTFLTLVGSGHDDGYFGGLTSPTDRLVTEVTLAFYDRSLKGDDTGPDRIRTLVDAAGPTVATLEDRS